jgi:hypothetical protein
MRVEQGARRGHNPGSPDFFLLRCNHIPPQDVFSPLNPLWHDPTWPASGMNVHSEFKIHIENGKSGDAKGDNHRAAGVRVGPVA